jgi:hypothetical protein
MERIWQYVYAEGLKTLSEDVRVVEAGVIHHLVHTLITA